MLGEEGKVQSSEGEFDGDEIVALLGLDHFVRVGPVESWETVGRVGDGVGSEPSDVSGGFGGGKRIVEFRFCGRTAREAFGEVSPLLQELGGAVVGPVGAIAERHGRGWLQRLHHANKVRLRAGRTARTCAGRMAQYGPSTEEASV